MRPPPYFVFVTWCLLFVATGFAAEIQSGIALIKHAPSINGRVEGSIQQMLPESVNLNGGGVITDSLMTPGTPTIRTNGNPVFGGIINGTGNASPSNFQITLNGNSTLGNLKCRIDALALPVVAAWPGPAGNRSVNINNPGQNLGDFATLKNLTLNGNAGQFAIPPGNYGDFTANGGSGFTLGVPGTSDPAIYYFQRFNLNGQSKIIVTGPVIIYLANGFNGNGGIGATANSAWLQIKIKNGGFTLNGGGSFFGHLVAPSGTVIINGNATFAGGVIADRLTVNGGALLRLTDAGTATPPVNQPPVAHPMSVTTDEDAPVALTLTGSDPESAVLAYTVLRPPLHGALSGTPPNLIYHPAPNYFGADAFSFKVNDGALDSTEVFITLGIALVNDAPSVEFTSPANQAVLLLGEAIQFSVTTADLDGIVSKVEFYDGTSKIGESTAAPFAFDWSGAQTGAHQISAIAKDDLGLASLPATLTLYVNTPPAVHAGEDLAITLPASATLAGTISDDGIPSTGTLSNLWSKISGPGSVTFSSETSADTTAVFSVPGIYLLRLTATDSMTFSFDEITVTVTENLPPTALSQTVALLENQSADIVLQGSDPENQPLAFSVITPPSHGTLTGVPPDLTYSPEPDFFGQDSFTFVTNDAFGSSQPAVVGITVTQEEIYPEVEILSPENGSPFPYGVAVPISFDPKNFGEGAVSVLFVLDHEVAETLDAPPYSYAWQGPAPGVHTFSAIAYNAAGEVATSYEYEFTVENILLDSTVEVQAGPDAIIALPGRLTLAATATQGGAPVSPALPGFWRKLGGPGNVIFPQVTSANGEASFSKAGEYEIEYVVRTPAGVARDALLVTVLPEIPPEKEGVSTSEGVNFLGVFLSSFSDQTESLRQSYSFQSTGKNASKLKVKEYFYGTPIFKKFDSNSADFRIIDSVSYPMDHYENQISRTAVDITSTELVQIQCNTLNDYISDTALVLPSHQLGLHYLVMAYGNDGFGGTECAIAANSDDTVIAITLAAPIPGYSQGETVRITLNKHEVFRMVNNTISNADFTGTEIYSNKPVAVFGGHRGQNIPRQFGDNDFLFEQIPPIKMWGLRYPLQPFTGRAGGDLIRILASEDNTRVSRQGKTMRILNKGEFFDFDLLAAEFLTADKPVLAAQFSKGAFFAISQGSPAGYAGDPSMAIVPSVEQFSRSVLWQTPILDSHIHTRSPGLSSTYLDPYDSYVNIVVDTLHSGAVSLNGNLIPATNFTPIGDSGFSGAAIPLDKKSVTSITAPVAVGTVFYGYNVLEAFSMPGSLSNKRDESYNILLYTSSAKNLVGNTGRVRGYIYDLDWNPVTNASVTFQTTGANPQAQTVVSTAEAFLDLSWPGFLAGTDSVSVNAGISTATISVQWIDPSGNIAPAVMLSGSSQVVANEPLFFQGNVSDDGPVEALSYVWDVISGPGPLYFTNSDESETQAYYDTFGRYRVRLTVSDGELSSSDEFEVLVNSESSIIQQFYPYTSAPLTVRGEGNLTLNYLAQDNDLDDSVAYVDVLANGEAVGRATLQQNASQPTYQFSWSVPPEPGDYYLRGRATDSHGTEALSEPWLVHVSPYPDFFIGTLSENQTFELGDSIRLGLVVTDGDSDTFYFTLNGELLTLDIPGYDDFSPEINYENGFGIDWLPTRLGNYQIAATATFNNGLGQTITRSTAPINITVNQPDFLVRTTYPKTNYSIPLGRPSDLAVEAVSQSDEIERVDFYIDDEFIGYDDTAPYTISWNPQNLGNATIAAWGILANGAGAKLSQPVTFNIVASPAIALVAAPQDSSLEVGSSVTLRATVIGYLGGSFPNRPTKCEFYQGDTLIGTVVQPLNNAYAPSPIIYTKVFTLTQLGPVPLRAEITDWRGFKISRSITITGTTSLVPTLALPADNAAFLLGNAITLQTTVVDPRHQLASLQFFANGEPVSPPSLNSTQAWNPALAGTYQITAIATDIFGNKISTPPRSIRVLNDFFTTLAWLQPQAAGYLAVNQPTVLSLQVSGADLQDLASLVFLANGQTIGTAQPGESSFLWTPPATGDYTLEAIATDLFGRTTSVAPRLVHVAVLHPPLARIVLPQADARFPSGTLVNFQIDATDADGQILKLRALVDGTEVVTTSQNTLSATLAALPGGWHTLVAEATDDMALTGSVSQRFYIERTLDGSLPVPQNLTGLANSSSEIQLDWQLSSPLPASASFILERRRGLDGAWEEITTLSDVPADNLSTIDAGLESQWFYYYRLATLNSAGERSAWSNEAGALTNVEMPQYAVIDLGASLRDSLVALQLLRPSQLYAQLSPNLPPASLIDLEDSTVLSIGENGDVLLKKPVAYAGQSIDYYLLWHLTTGKSEAIVEPGFKAVQIGRDGSILGSLDYSNPALGATEADRIAQSFSFWPGVGSEPGRIERNPDRIIDVRAARWTAAAGLVDLTVDPQSFALDSSQPPRTRSQSYASLQTARDSDATGTAVGTGTWQELRDVFASHDFTLDTTYAPFSYQHAMRWRAGGWDLVGALQLGSNIRNEALLTATNTSGTLSIGVSAKTTGGNGGTFAIRTRLPYGTGLGYYSLGDQNLEELRPLGNSLYSGATDLDDAGNAVGYSYLNSSEPFYRTQAVLWENDFASGSHPVTAALQLANLPGRNINYPQGYGYARAIDRAGNLIVGQSLGEYPVAGAQPPRTEIRPAATAWVKNLARQTASGTSTAAWETIDLNDQISDKTWQLGNAVDVNTTGIIIGMGLHNGQTRAFLLLPVEVAVKKKGETTAPTDGLIVKKGDILEFKLTEITQENFPVPAAQIVWYQQQLKTDGEWTVWQDIGPAARGVKFEHTTAASGVFQVKAVLMGQQENAVFYSRKKDEVKSIPGNPKFKYGDGKKGEPDAIGIVDDEIQIAICEEAAISLGSTLYAAASTVAVHGKFQEVPPTNHCNIFVAHKADDGGGIIPLINGFLPPYDPPLANQWSGTQVTVVTGYEGQELNAALDRWRLLPADAFPQPGFIIARASPIPSEGSPRESGHVGIVSYDGYPAAAGPAYVYKVHAHDLLSPISRLRSYDPDYHPTYVEGWLP